MRPESLEVLEDFTARSRPDEGYLRVRRMRVRHHYPDGSSSPPYECDVVSRRWVDAVTVVLWNRDEQGVVRVVLKDGVRPPVWFRRQAELVRPDPEAPLVLTELPAGVLEESDIGPDGLQQRSAAESEEEVGVRLPKEAFRMLGAGAYPSPGITDEHTAFLEAEIEELPDEGAEVSGDGSGMEHGTRAVVMELDEAIARCVDGRIQDMKTEIGLRRLRDLLNRGG